MEGPGKFSTVKCLVIVSFTLVYGEILHEPNVQKYKPEEGNAILFSENNKENLKKKISSKVPRKNNSGRLKNKVMEQSFEYLNIN